MLHFLELNSIRHRMLSGFLFLTLLVALIGGVSIYLFIEMNRMANTHRLINQLQVYTLNLIKTDNDFFDFEASNEIYFKEHKSEYLLTRDSLRKQLAQGLLQTENESRDNNYPFYFHLVSIDSLFSLYDEKFQELEALVFERGFKEYGLEGDMRKHAHALEVPAMGIALSDLLSLRRHEKDFFLRHDTIYQHQFNKVCSNLMASLSRNPTRYKGTLFHLNQYRHFFNLRVEVEKKIGLTNELGVRSELNTLTSRLSHEYFALTEYASNLYSKIQRQAGIFYVAITVAAIIFSIISGFWISKRLSEPIAKLSKMVNSAAFSGSRTSELNLKNAAIEINELTGSFVKLIDMTTKQMREIEDKSHLLKTQNDELNKLNHELDNFLYSTAHDLRAPLASLLGIVRLMYHDNQQKQLIPYLDMMQKSILRQEDFIGQIVNYAKNKKLDIVPEKIDLKKVLLEIFQNHEFAPGASETEKFIHVREDAPFYSDLNSVLVIFNNLISNAIRYSDATKDERFIQIRIHVQDDSASIEFADNGIGISREHIGRIFDMFYRASSKSVGSGLGLFIFREAIRKMNGLVNVESELGVGTKFFIQLPNLTQQASLPLHQLAEVM